MADETQQPSGQAGQPADDALNGARQQAEQQIDSAIDQLAQKVPGGDQLAQQAKQVADNALDNLEKEAQQRIGDALKGGLGGLFGGKKD